MQKLHSKAKIAQCKIHILVLEKFIPAFLSHAKQYLDFDTHLFLIFASDKKLKEFRLPDDLINHQNIIVLNSKIHGRFRKYLFLARYIHYAQKIFIHGLWMEYVNIILALLFYKLKKCHWLIWGGDLYDYRTNKKYSQKELIRKFIIKRFGFITPVVEGDYKLAQKHYKTNAVCIGENFYMQFYEKYKDLKLPSSQESKKTIIQVGNSATQSNAHQEVLEILEPYKEDIEIILPLSYGDKSYAEEIKKLALEKFGNNAKILQDFIPLQDYNQILQSIDIAIFATDRQQAMGNIFVLLALGKKIYLKEGYTHYESLKQKGFKIFDIKKFDLKKLSQEESNHNRHFIFEKYSQEKQIQNFKFIYDGICQK